MQKSVKMVRLNLRSLQLPLLLVLIGALHNPVNTTVSDYCDDLNDQLSEEYDKIINANSTVRKVDLESGLDEEECLNANRTSDPTPCLTLLYALHGDTNEDNMENAASDLVVYLGPGVYRSFENTTRAVNSHRVAFIGAGASRTIVTCGTSGKNDVPCSFPNFQIRNSSHVLVSGITFTGCGPITSSLFVGQSDYIFIENCSFENDTSPASLFYNTPNLRISNCSFLGNHPEELDQEVVHSTCYRPLGEESDAFFLDNRTSGGGLTYYSEDATTKLVIQDALFVDNNARPDLDVGLIRRSRRYGHGGAISIRLLNSTNSTVCIRDSVFLRNVAEAHAGAMAVTVAGSSTNNKIAVLRSVFRRNMCQIENCTGGAVGIYFFSGTQLNTILFADCNFTNNEARSSGAMVLSTSVSAEQVEGESDILRLTNCQFRNNRAFYEGTALGVFSLTHTNLIGIPVELDNCNFYQNHGTDGSIDTTAVTVYRVLLTILGNTTFRGNTGGGATLLSSRLDVRGAAIFDSNTAVFGAGIAMAGRSLMLLHENSSIMFSNNFAFELGAGLYVEDPSSDFTLSILNTGCFIRYNTSLVDIPPYEWNTSVVFKNNTAAVAGAAIYANDMSRCRWVGTECPTRFLGKALEKPTIFDLSPECSPFEFENNTVDIPGGALPRGEIVNQVLATDPTNISAKANYTVVGYGERLAVRLSSEDDQGNFREAVWSVSAPSEPQTFGALSSNNTVYTYTVPSKSQLLKEASALTINEQNTNFSVTFTLLLNESAAQSAPVSLSLTEAGCHPGYVLDNSSQTCVCYNGRDIVRCDSDNRYFYGRDGLWVGTENGTVYFANTVPGFLKCVRAGTLPGCQFRFDDPDLQCATGRSGILCGNCRSGYGVTFDLRYCKTCNVFGVLVYLLIVIITPIVSLGILYFDLPLPNELKGVIFYLQVVGVIYRSTPYLNEEESSSTFFDFIANVFGFAMPIPLCFHESLSVIPVALLGYVPPGLALLTAIAYGLCARHVKMLSHREQYGFHGFYFLLVFIYKYIIDTSFILVSCTNVNRKQVFLYQGTLECYKYPFVLLVVLGSSLLVLFGVVLPLYILKIIYAPGKMISVRNALTHGLKNKRRYLWYGLWDIWRRLLFVAASLFISIASRSIVLLIQCILILFCLWVLCFVRPYKKYHINVIEGLMILSLFSTTLSVYDRENDFHVGRITGIVALAIPYTYGILFILYRIIRLVWKKLWPVLKKRHMLESKLEKAQRKCSEVADVVKGKTLNLVGERIEGTNEKFMKNTGTNNTGLEETFASDLRESLLEDNTET